MAATKTRSTSATAAKAPALGRSVAKSSPKAAAAPAPKKRRSSKKGRGGGLWVLAGLLALTLMTGLVGGYLWRSLSPLPIEGPLGTGDPQMGPATLEVVAQDNAHRAQEAEAEVRNLRAQLNTLLERQERTEAELADIQIRSMLGGE